MRSIRLSVFGVDQRGDLGLGLVGDENEVEAEGGKVQRGGTKNRGLIRHRIGPRAVKEVQSCTGCSNGKTLRGQEEKDAHGQALCSGSLALVLFQRDGGLVSLLRRLCVLAHAGSWAAYVWRRRPTGADAGPLPPFDRAEH